MPVEAPPWWAVPPRLPSDPVRLEASAAATLLLVASQVWHRPLLLATLALAVGLALVAVRRSRRLAATWVGGTAAGTATGWLLTAVGAWVPAEPAVLGLPPWSPTGGGLAALVLWRVGTSVVRHSHGPPPPVQTSPVPPSPAPPPPVPLDRPPATVAPARPRVCAVVPARNEAPLVGGVVRTLQASRAVDDVVVVDNASTDATTAEARRAGARVVHEPVPGKGQAMRRGAAATDAEILLFVDADLLGLDSRHVEVLVASVASGESDMACGLWDRGPVWNWLLCNFVPIVTGQRAIRRDLFLSLPPGVAAGYRVEAALNAHVARGRYRRTHCILTGLGHRSQATKVANRLAGTLHVGRVIVVGSWTALAVRVFRHRLRAALPAPATLPAPVVPVVPVVPLVQVVPGSPAALALAAALTIPLVPRAPVPPPQARTGPLAGPVAAVDTAP